MIPLFDPKADVEASDAQLAGKQFRYEQWDTTPLRSYLEGALGTVAHLRPLGAGTNALDHLVYEVQFPNGVRRICRVSTDAPKATNIAVESALFTLWRSAGVPAPEVNAVHLRTDEFPFDAMVMEHLGPHTLEAVLHDSPQHREEWLVRAGAFLARLHQVPISGYGGLVLKGTTLTGYFTSWKDALQQGLPETILFLSKERLLKKEEALDIERICDRSLSSLTIERSVTIHGDYHHANILIDPVESKILGAIDLSQAKAGDPVFDIAFYSTYLTDSEFASCLRGYTSVSSLPHDFQKRFLFYRLRILLSKIRLRKRFGFTSRIPPAVEQVRRALGESL